MLIQSRQTQPSRGPGRDASDWQIIYLAAVSIEPGGPGGGGCKSCRPAPPLIQKQPAGSSSEPVLFCRSSEPDMPWHRYRHPQPVHKATSSYAQSTCMARERFCAGDLAAIRTVDKATCRLTSVGLPRPAPLSHGEDHPEEWSCTMASHGLLKFAPVLPEPAQSGVHLLGMHRLRAESRALCCAARLLLAEGKPSWTDEHESNQSAKQDIARSAPKSA